MSIQPNILFIMADQLAPQFTGAYGHPVVKTPNLDKLAQRGMRFDATYCNSPLCAPSRASVMTGQHISAIETWDNAAEFGAQYPTFAHYLKQMGYRTCLSGKMHFVGPDQMHGFEERVTTDIYPSDFAWTPDWTHADQRIDKWYHNMATVKESGQAMATYQIDYDEEVGFAAKRRLFDYAREGDQPWFLMASFIHPHDPYVARPEWWNLYTDNEIDMPQVEVALQDHDPFSRRVMDGIEASDKPLTPDEIRAARRAYYANVSYFDSKIGELVQTLEETGQLDNTIVIVTSDHGDMLGERGLWFKMNFFEHSVRVPLVIAGPGVENGKATNSCSLVDMLPTFLDIAGDDAPKVGMPLAGRSLMPLARGQDDPVDEAIAEYCAEMTGSPVFMIRRGVYKYIHCDDDPAQLYDLHNDPQELRNLANEAEFASIAEAFASEVAERWDAPAIKEKVIASQQMRFATNAAMEAGAREDWDYNPPRDAAAEYVRNRSDWSAIAATYRFPPIED